MLMQHVLRSIVEKQYLKGLSQKVDRKLVRQIEELYKEIVKTNQHWAIDRPSVFNLAISSLVLASYKVLKPVLAEDQWRNVIRYALIERTQEKQRFFMRLFLKLDPNPFARIGKISKTNKSNITEKINSRMKSSWIQRRNMCCGCINAFTIISSGNMMPEN